MEQYDTSFILNILEQRPLILLLKNGNSCMVSSLCNINLNNLKDVRIDDL